MNTSIGHLACIAPPLGCRVHCLQDGAVCSIYYIILTCACGIWAHLCGLQHLPCISTVLSSTCKALLFAGCTWQFASGCLYPIAFLTLELHLPDKVLAVPAWVGRRAIPRYQGYLSASQERQTGRTTEVHTECQAVIAMPHMCVPTVWRDTSAEHACACVAQDIPDRPISSNHHRSLCDHRSGVCAPLDQRARQLHHRGQVHFDGGVPGGGGIHLGPRHHPAPWPPRTQGPAVGRQPCSLCPRPFE